MKEGLSTLAFLYNANLQEQLNEVGYTVVPFLEKSEIDEIQAFYNLNKPDQQHAFHTTHFFTDREYKRLVNSFLIAACRRAFYKHVTKDYNPVFANFMVKEANSNSLMPLHADWCYVDEMKNSSYAVWVALTDTDEKNGCFCVIPYSHNLVNQVRGPRILQWNYPTNEMLIKEMGVPLPVKAGTAVIYNHRLMHYSGANQSSTTRVAFNVSVVPDDVPGIHYAMPEGESEIVKYSVSGPDFYLEYDHFRTPDQKIEIDRLSVEGVSVIDNKVPDFIKQYKKVRQQKTGWDFIANMLAKLFS